MLAQSYNMRAASGSSATATAAAWPIPSVAKSTQVTTVENSIELMGGATSYTRNTEIYGENEPAEYLYKVVSGAVRTYKVLSDGRRQVSAFYLPGDFFGFEVGEAHLFSAEAVCESKVIAIKRCSLAMLAARNADVARQLWTITSDELRRAQSHIILLIKTAQERVAGFLLDMAARSSSTNAVDLPMSRQDIADYLGLTIETVSRTLTQLENQTAISVPSSRHIVLCNRNALKRMSS